MNQSDFLFITVSFGLGIGVGASVARTFGFVGFIGGFLATIVCTLTILGVVRLILWNKRSKGKKKKDRGVGNSHD
jgi:hypothetical protein